MKTFKLLRNTQVQVNHLKEQKQNGCITDGEVGAVNSTVCGVYSKFLVNLRGG